MIKKTTIFAILTCMAIGHAQTIHVSGVVQDRSGNGIAGATVTLESANSTTTTDTKGSFTITGIPTALQQGKHSLSSVATPVHFQNGRIELYLASNTQVAVSVFDVSGRMLLSSRELYSAGKHILSPLKSSAGLHLYKITIKEKKYLIMSIPHRTFSRVAQPVSKNINGSIQSGQVKTAAVISEVINVTKRGWLTYRESINIPEMSEINIKLIRSAEMVADADGNEYQTVIIGNQIWTAENLRTTKYNDGTEIPLVSDGSAWSGLTTGAYCYYENHAQNAGNNGALYNWFAIGTGKLAPEGWRVSTDGDWDTLMNYFIANGYNWDGTSDSKWYNTTSTPSNKIAKALSGQAYWTTGNNPEIGTISNDLSKNNSGHFSAFPGGCRYSGGSFSGQSFNGSWWCDTDYEPNPIFALSRILNAGNVSLGKELPDKRNGLSVRLVRNDHVNSSHIITFNGNGNTGGTVPPQQSKTPGIPLVLTENTGNLNKPGYFLAGWNTSPDGKGKLYKEGASYTIESAENVTLFADWRAYDPMISDVDGNVYTTLLVGTQLWTVENLRTTRYNDSTPIPCVKDSAAWLNLSTPGYCFYANTTDTGEQKKYGVLYNFFTVETGKLAPKGWRVPTDADWTRLEKRFIARGYNYDSTTTDNTLAKSLAAKTDWELSTSNGAPGNDLISNNVSGFSAFPAGCRSELGRFYTRGYSCYWWYTTSSDVSGGCSRYIDRNYPDLDKLYGSKLRGQSVRLVRDLN